MASLPTTFTHLRASRSFTVGDGTSSIARISSSAVTYDFASMGANARSSVSQPVPGARVGDAVAIALPSTWSGDYLNIMITPQVLQDGFVTLTASNKSSGTINPDAVLVRLVAFGF